MASAPITLDQLAEMTQREFSALRGELKSLRTDVALRSDMETGFQAVVGVLDAIRQDLAETKRSLTLLAQTIGGELGDLRSRVERIEKHLGMPVR